MEEICHTDVGVQSRWWAVIALCDVEAPFLRATSAADESNETSASHEEIDAFHAPALLLFVQPSAPLAPVAMFVCPGSLALLRGRRGGVKLGLGDVLAERAINAVDHVLERDEGTVGRVNVELPGEVGDGDDDEGHRRVGGGL